MKTIYTEILHSNANLRFQKAESELQKGPERDSYAACMNCKIAMRQYLSAYLIDHGLEPGNFQTLHLLTEKCKSVSENFEDIDLKYIGCRYEQLNEDHCSNDVHLKNCLETVRAIKDHMVE